MRNHPPVIPTWLLEHFVNHDTALVGDLLEECRQGRSTAWYWREVLTAIVVGSFQTIRTHIWLALRALALGWIFITAASRLAFPYVPRSMVWLVGHGIISRHMFTYVFPLSTVMLILAISVTGGWIIARTHRPYSTAMVLLLLISVIVRIVPTLPWFFRLLGDTFENSRYIPAFLSLLSNYIAIIVGWLFGGLLGSESSIYQEERGQTAKVE